MPTVAVAALCLLASACSGNASGGALAVPSSTSTPPESLEVNEPTAIVRRVEPDQEAIQAVIDSMTTEQKIGQLLMPVVHGTDAVTVSDQDRRLNLDAFGYATPSEIVDAYQLGGVLYLEQNVTSADQLRVFSGQLQVASQSSIGLGLLVAVDQEGGRVNRIFDRVTVFPSASTLAGDPVAVKEAAYVTGQQVAQQGVNVVLAPVADVLLPGQQAGAIGSRSFGDDPGLVASMVEASIDGLQESGVAAAVKHWPGHGATTVDSHRSLPVLDIDRATWEQRDRVPFAAAVDRDVAIVLVGHLALPQIDNSGQAATISSTLIDGLLRSELGFDGVVMTDALNMGAVSGVGDGELAVQALEAGADILLFPRELVSVSEALNQAVSSGRITTERLDGAVRRVVALKFKLGLLPVG